MRRLVWLFLMPVALGASSEQSLDAGWKSSVDDVPAGQSGVTLPCQGSRPGAYTYRRALNVPSEWRTRHLRLRLLTTPPAADVYVDGTKLMRSGSVYDLTPILQAGVPSDLTVKLVCPGGMCGIIEAVLLATPRVFLEGETYRASSRTLEVTTTIRNTLDNTANVDLHWELSYEGRVVATFARAATVPPSMAQDVTVQLISAAPLERWGIHDPRIYRLRTIMVKNEEAVEGDYDMERAVRVLVREVSEHPWRVNGEMVRLNSQALPQCYPDRNKIRVLLDTPAEVLSTGELPAASWIQQAAEELGILISTATERGGTRRSGLRIAGAYLERGDTVVELENLAEEGQYTLRRIQVTAGHISQTVDELRPGERRQLRFEHVNPYRVEVKSAAGVTLLAR